MKLLMTLWISCSLLQGCATLKKPDVDIMLVNAASKKRCGYNLRNDYDDSGNLKAGVKPVCRKNESLADLNKAVLFDKDPAGNVHHFEDALAEMKAWIKNLREAYDRDCKPPASISQ